MIYVIVLLFLLVFFGWNVFLWGYKDRYTHPIEPAISEVFDQRCLPIIMKHEKRSDRAILMVHGFPSTPYTYRYAAQRCYDAGYDVYVPLLPGFGTKPEDLYATTCTQWYGYLSTYYRELRKSYPILSVLGTSMGGSLTLKIGEEFSQTPLAPQSLVVIAAPVFLNSLKYRVVQQWGVFVLRFVALFTPALKPGIQYGKKRENDGEELWIGYSGQFIRGGLSLLRALQTIRKELDSITVPTLMLHDIQDGTVPYQNMIEIHDKISSQHKIARSVAMEATHSKHVLLMYPSIQKTLVDEILDFLSTAETLPQGEKTI